MKIIMLAGAGSVGKTVLLNAIADMAKKRGLRVGTCYSTTRRTYEKFGFTNESEALKNPEINMNFQNNVLSDNICELENAVEKFAGQNYELLITDRSPYDYAAYYFTVFQDWLGLKIIEDKRETCDQAMMRLQRLTQDRINVTLLPYPTTWALDTQSSDGWRADKTGKNFVWSAVVEAELQDAKYRLEAKRLCSPIFIKRMVSFYERADVQTRAAYVLGEVFPQLR